MTIQLPTDLGFVVTLFVVGVAIPLLVVIAYGLSGRIPQSRDLKRLRLSDKFHTLDADVQTAILYALGEGDEARRVADQKLTDLLINSAIAIHDSERITGELREGTLGLRDEVRALRDQVLDAPGDDLDEGPSVDRENHVDDDDLRPTVAEVEAKRAELEAAGKPAGVGSLAKALGTSEATVRRRLGKL
jgi:hypothetical protein